MKKLYLDDYRFPKESSDTMYRRVGPENVLYLEDDWDIVRSYDEFKDYILSNSDIGLISFDYDLDEYENWEEGTTGADCFYFLYHHYRRNYKKNFKFPKIFVHSANIGGSQYLMFLRDLVHKYERSILNFPKYNLELYDTLIPDYFENNKWNLEAMQDILKTHRIINF